MNAKDRLESLVNYFNISIKAMSEMCGYDRPQAFYDVQKGKTKEISSSMANKIISAFPEINKIWLLTGEGDMLKKETTSVIQNNHHGDNINGVNVSIGGNSNHAHPNTGNIGEALPVIPIEIYKETNVNVVEYVEKNQERLMKKPKIPMFPEYTAFYQVYDESMADKFKAGDMLALKPIQWSWLINGEPLVINTFSYGLVLRRVKYSSGDDFITCVSENRDVFPDFTIPIKDIANTFRIVGMIRFNV